MVVILKKGSYKRYILLVVFCCSMYTIAFSKYFENTNFKKNSMSIGFGASFTKPVYSSLQFSYNRMKENGMYYGVNYQYNATTVKYEWINYGNYSLHYLNQVYAVKIGLIKKLSPQLFADIGTQFEINNLKIKLVDFDDGMENSLLRKSQKTAVSICICPKIKYAFNNLHHIFIQSNISNNRFDPKLTFLAGYEYKF